MASIEFDLVRWCPCKNCWLTNGCTVAVARLLKCSVTNKFALCLPLTSQSRARALELVQQSVNGVVQESHTGKHCASRCALSTTVVNRRSRREQGVSTP